MSDNIYELYAIHYATHEGRTHSSNYLHADSHDTIEELFYYVWAAVSPSHTVVIDTGMTKRASDAHKRKYLITPSEGLAALDVDAAKVPDVVITHMHYDHAGTWDAFPAARFHLQEREMRYATGRHMAEKPLRGGYFVNDVAGLVRQVYADRVTFHDGDGEVAPGITVHRVGGHAPGLQIVRVMTKRGWVVLASDASHFYANFQERRLFPMVVDQGEMVAGWKRLTDLAASPRHVVPGHDPKVMGRYPAARPELAGRAVRLDVDPLENEP
jgi:glyoxylase-like metal-dependent hydrolase (beta-lactamase superfamily II)